MNYVVANIAEELANARRKSRMTQTQLAARLGVPQSYISKLEKGHADFRVSKLVEVSRLVGLEMMLIPRHLVPMVDALIAVHTKGGVMSEDSPAITPDEDDDE